MKNVARLVIAVAIWLVAGCGNEDSDMKITGPELPRGTGSIYPVKDVTFNTVDDVTINARYGHLIDSGPNPVVILVHDVGGTSEVIGGLEWLFSGFFEQLLEAGYSPLAIDLRGHGSTPFPDDDRTQEALLVSDTRNFHLDVHAALNWLKAESSADIGRVAIVGNGGGGNVAYVSMGAFPEDLRAGVALSPGVWDFSTREALVLGERVEDFFPHSMMFLVAADDILPLNENEFLSYAGFASVLNELTNDPKNLIVYEDESAHGLDLLENSAVVATMLSWLEAHL